MSKRFTTSTLKDIADKSKVSIATVSRVLGNSPNFHVNPDTKKRIFHAAKELNYRPNTVARSLRIRKTFTLGLFIPYLGNPVFPEIVKGVEDAAAEKGYTIFISHLRPQTTKKKSYINWIRENRVDGLIMATALIDDVIINDLIQNNCPFVLVNRLATNVNNYVVLDDVAGAKMAVNHLIHLGHRRIAHIAGPLMFDTSVRRLQGYRKALADSGISYDGQLVEETDWMNWTDGRKTMSRILSCDSRPTAVFAGNMMSAIGAMASIREAGIKIPDDISIICLHDAPLAEIMEPPLSVVKMPLYEMGRHAAQWIIQALDDQAPTNPVILPPERLVIRGSTAAIKI